MGWETHYAMIWPVPWGGGAYSFLPIRLYKLKIGTPQDGQSDPLAASSMQIYRPGGRFHTGKHQSATFPSKPITTPPPGVGGLT